MDSLMRLWIVLSLLFAISTATSITPTDLAAPFDQAGSDAITLSISKGEQMIEIGPVAGLTMTAKSAVPPTGLTGPAFLTTNSNQDDLDSNVIAVISCDPYSGYMQADNVLDAATQANVTGVVFYSEADQRCAMSDYAGTYAWIYTMESYSDTKRMLNALDASDNGVVYAGIGMQGSLKLLNGTNDDSQDSSSDAHTQHKPQDSWGPSPSTAVAMIILYSVTGLITALFLIIIVTGAFRAHRHPERYGPRNTMGRPRQSRAKGLARAMLDTLPIVKTGEREQPKPTDVELATVSDGDTRTVDGRGATDASDTEGIPITAAQTAPQEQQEQWRDSTNDRGIEPATDSIPAEDADNKGCSICTEDFEPGQDQRVLPCDHRFHPDCVDPWLLNVSGTCPLCRIDLRPQTSNTPQLDDNGNPIPALQEGEFNPDLAPPLGPNETAGDVRRMSVRRSIIMAIMDIGRPDRLTREERVMALRQLRGQQLARQRREEQAEVTETPEEESRMRRRLSSLLNVRTRRMERQGQQVQPGTDIVPETTEEHEAR